MFKSSFLTRASIAAGGMQDPSSSLLTRTVGMASAAIQHSYSSPQTPGSTKLVKSPTGLSSNGLATARPDRVLQFSSNLMTEHVMTDAEASSHTPCTGWDTSKYQQAECPDDSITAEAAKASTANDGNTVTSLAAFYAIHNPSLVPEAQHIAMRYNSTQQLQAALLDRYGADLRCVGASIVPVGLFHDYVTHSARNSVRSKVCGRV